MAVSERTPPAARFAHVFTDNERADRANIDDAELG